MKFLKKYLIRIIILLVVLISVVLLVIKMVMESQEGTSANERALIQAAKKYYADMNQALPKENYSTAIVSSSLLMSKGYLKPIVDGNNNVVECNSHVTVVKVNTEYFYSPYVDCNLNDDTKLLYDILVSTVSVSTTKDGSSGLYQTGSEYSYRGDQPNNYIRFANKLWRIIKIDADRNIKLIYAGSDFKSVEWDNRYNIDRKDNTGINDFSVSRVRDYLYSYLNNSENFPAQSKSRIALVDICVGKRSEKDLSIDGSTECKSKLNDQMIYLLQANEYLNTSNDPNCPNVTEKACQNYNYLSKLSSYWSITGVEGSTSKAFRIFPAEGLVSRDTSSVLNILPVLSLRSDAVWMGGNGTKTNPYTIR